MNEQFVPYEIAIKLKEKGFDELCMAYYNTEDFYNHKGLHKPGEWFNITSTPVKDYNKESFVIVPLWQQVIDWIKSKGILITELWNGWEYAKLEEDFTYVQTKEQAIEHALTLI